MQGEGIAYNEAVAYHLKNDLICQDRRVGDRNVLRLRHSALEFERMFVFFNDVPIFERMAVGAKRQAMKVLDQSNFANLKAQKNYNSLEVKEFPVTVNMTLKDSCTVIAAKCSEGEKMLAKFMEAIQVLLDKLFETTNDYRGQIANVVSVPRPPSPTALLNELGPEGIKKRGVGVKREFDIGDMWLTQIYDMQLSCINKLTNE